MKTQGNAVLACSAGILLGLSFPPIPLALLAFVGLVPLFLLLDRLEGYLRALRYTYLTFLVFNIITLYWVGGFTHGKDIFLMLAGAALLIVHPVFFLVPILAYLFIKKNIGGGVALAAIPFVWVGFEWLHSLGEVGFPWLTLGNSQSSAIERVQFITATGVYGISFWIVAVNALVYYIFRNIRKAEWRLTSKRSVLAILSMVIIVLLPGVQGRVILSVSPSIRDHTSLRVAMLQPNFDPWKKWQASPEEQVQHYLRLTGGLVGQKAGLIIWPETAIAFRILSSKYADLFRELKSSVDTFGVPLLTGFADIVFYEAGNPPPGSHVIRGTEIHYDDFNAIMLLEPRSDRVQKYAKMKLVPFGERVPYAEKLTFLVDAIKWDVGISGWGIGRDTTVFALVRSGSSAKFSAMVCYESIYPDLVASFVRKGAQFLVVITNDSWYGNTSGPYQHAQYAVLRAIENRRAIARCANGGVSCLIDPYGRVSEVRDMFTESSVVGDVELSDEATFYSRHGDVFAEACTGVGVIAVLAAVVGKFSRRAKST